MLAEQSNDDDTTKQRNDDGNRRSMRRHQESKRSSRNGHQNRNRRRRQIRESTKVEENHDSSDISTGSFRIPLSDLATIASIVRTGVIGHTDHPDFQLLVEWITYQRQIEFTTGQDDNRYARQRRRQIPSVATSTVEASDTMEPLLWCEL